MEIYSPTNWTTVTGEGQFIMNPAELSALVEEAFARSRLAPETNIYTYIPSAETAKLLGPEELFDFGDCQKKHPFILEELTNWEGDRIYDIVFSYRPTTLRQVQDTRRILAFCMNMIKQDAVDLWPYYWS